MTDFDDGYDSYYAERLWSLIPGTIRGSDSATFGVEGPLQELLNRVAGQVAVVRRSIDRMWADQAIETCDDWVIPYIGDLLGTNLVNALDTAGQRLDVAKTIHYRRRKGTIEVLEELARDMTGWDAHVVEGFRRLGRTRHGLDPAVGAGGYPNSQTGDITELLSAEGLVGQFSSTPAGGTLDLRNVAGAAAVNGPFDEGFHTADMRFGQGAVGRYGIPKLLVFLWRLESFAVGPSTPVAVPGCSNLSYTFDPTGRKNPLFLPPPPEVEDFADTWTPAEPWQVPGPLTPELQQLMVANDVSMPYSITSATLNEVAPETGCFTTTAAPTGPITTDCHYGFPATIGAGPYDRGLLGDPPSQVTPVQPTVSGGMGLDTALSSAPTTSTVVIGDSLTYTALKPIGTSAAPVVSMLIQAGPEERPVLRIPAVSGPWIITGGLDATGTGTTLVLDGLWLSGIDVVLRGSFESVRITGCTLDPGSAVTGTVAPGSSPLAEAVDGVALTPTRIFVEADPSKPAGQGGSITNFSVDHSVIGPIRTRFGGSVENLTISDTTVQGLAITSGSVYAEADVYDPLLLAKGLVADDPLSAKLLSLMPVASQTAVQTLAGDTPAAAQAADLTPIVAGLNALVSATAFYDPTLFATVDLDPDTAALGDAASTLDATDLAALNRALVDASFPVALGVAGLAVVDAAVTLLRVTVMGPVAIHRLEASDTLIAGFAVVDDIQDGCFRFSAAVTGSRIPRQYESALVTTHPSLFTSDVFGSPGYGQLLETVDASIVGGTAGASIAQGAETSSEMGAYSADLDPLKEEAVLIKYAEYMPLGLIPVLIHVT